MPLNIADPSTTPFDLEDVPEKFLIFFSSIVDGQPWCPDCRRVDGLLKETFEPEDAPAALLVYVGTRPEWKSPSNVFRGEPWKVDSIPTIIRLKDHKENGRIVDQKITKKNLARFIEG